MAGDAGADGDGASTSTVGIEPQTPSLRLVVQPVNLGATTIGHESVVGSLVIVTAPLPVCVATEEGFVATVATNEEPPPPPLLESAVPPPAP